MAEKKGKSIPIWFNETEHKRLEEAAALMGYRALSTYIKDKIFNRRDCKNLDFAGQGDWELNAELISKMDVIAADQNMVKTMLVASLMMLNKQLSGAEQKQIGMLIGQSANCEVALGHVGEVGTAINKLTGETSEQYR